MSKFLAPCLGLLLLAAWALPALAGEPVPRMAPKTLKARLAGVVVLDVRTPRDWTASGSKIKGAIRMAPSQANRWAKWLDKDKTYVLYCS